MPGETKKIITKRTGNQEHFINIIKELVDVKNIENSHILLPSQDFREGLISQGLIKINPKL